MEFLFFHMIFLSDLNKNFRQKITSKNCNKNKTDYISNNNDQSELLKNLANVPTGNSFTLTLIQKFRIQSTTVITFFHTSKYDLKPFETN